MMLPHDDPRLTPVHLRRELLASGYDDRLLKKAVRDGTLMRVRPGAFVDATTFAGLDKVAAHAVRARAAARQAKTGVVISHASALTFQRHDMPTYGMDLSDVHLTRLDGKAGRREAGVRQHRGIVAPSDIVEVDDFSVMSAPRALLETTTLLPVEPALVVANHMLHEKVVTKEELCERYADSIHRWPRSLTTDLVLRLADARIESVGESRTHYCLFRQGLPRPVAQLAIFDERGVEVARLDFAWPDRRVWLEFDGKVKYQRLLREGESPADVVVREKQRQEMVEQITGWRCIRITWDDLRHPERIAAKIRAAFAEMARRPA